MKILKMLAIVLVLGIAVAIGVAYYASGRLDGYIKESIEKYVSQSLGTKVTVGKVSLSVQKTTATITDLQIANPPGFTGDSAFKAGVIEITLNPKESNLRSVIIDRVLLSQPTVHYVKTKETDNFSVLQKNAENYLQATKKEGAATKPTAESKESKQPRILIKKLDIEGANLTYHDMRILSADVNLKLNDIHIKNIDTGEDGSSTQAAIGKITDAVIPEIKNAALQSVNTYLNLATDTIRNVTDTAQQYGKDAITNIKKLFQK